jgi:hypothetical protein
MTIVTFVTLALFFGLRIALTGLRINYGRSRSGAGMDLGGSVLFMFDRFDDIDCGRLLCREGSCRLDGY